MNDFNNHYQPPIENLETKQYSFSEACNTIDDILKTVKENCNMPDNTKIDDLVNKFNKSQIDTISTIIKQASTVFFKFDKLNKAFNTPFDTRSATQALKSSAAELVSIYVEDESSKNFNSVLSKTTEYHVLQAAAFFNEMNNSSNTRKVMRNPAQDTKIKIIRLIEFLQSLSKYKNEIINPNLEPKSDSQSEASTIQQNSTDTKNSINQILS